MYDQSYNFAHLLDKSSHNRCRKYGLVTEMCCGTVHFMVELSDAKRHCQTSTQTPFVLRLGSLMLKSFHVKRHGVRMHVLCDKMSPGTPLDPGSQGLPWIPCPRASPGSRVLGTPLGPRFPWGGPGSPNLPWDLTPVSLKTNCMTRPQQASNIPSKCVTQ